MSHPKFQFLVPHSPQWRGLRREEQQRRRKIRDCEGNERLAPGPLPDPDLERRLINLTTAITEREWKEFRKHQRKDMTKATFARFIICQFLEAKRPKMSLTKSFVEWAADTGSAQRAGV